MQGKNTQRAPAGIPLQSVRFTKVQTFGQGQRRRAIEIDNTREGWAKGTLMRWLPFGVEVRFNDGEVYLVGHSAIETARVEPTPQTDLSAA